MICVAVLNEIIHFDAHTDSHTHPRSWLLLFFFGSSTCKNAPDLGEGVAQSYVQDWFGLLFGLAPITMAAAMRRCCRAMTTARASINCTSMPVTTTAHVA